MKKIKSSQAFLFINQNQKQVQNPQVQERISIRNKHIQTAQIQYCRFIYYLIKNTHHLSISQISKDKLTLICHRHLHKLINNLADEQRNWFRLKNWKAYKASNNYKSIQLDIKRYYKRYQQSYQNFIKDQKFKITCQMNQYLTQMQDQKSFSRQIYMIMARAIASIIRQANHNISVIFSNSSISSSPEVKASIQGLKSLYQYYNLIKISLNSFEDYDYFERSSNIKMQIDYQTAPNISMNEYNQLRQALKRI